MNLAASHTEARPLPWKHYKFQTAGSRNEDLKFATVDSNEIILYMYKIIRKPNSSDLITFDRIRNINSLEVVFSEHKKLCFKWREEINILDEEEFISLKLPSITPDFSGLYSIKYPPYNMQIIDPFLWKLPPKKHVLIGPQLPKRVPQLPTAQEDNHILLLTRIAVAREIRQQLQLSKVARFVTFSMPRIPTSFINYLLQQIPQSASYLVAGEDARGKLY